MVLILLKIFVMVSLSFLDPDDGSTTLQFSANQKYDVSLTLPKGFSGDYDDLN